MTKPTLSIEGFQTLLDRLGGNLEAWPDSDRSTAETLLATSPEAQRRLDEAKALDEILKDVPKAPPGLADRIVAAALAKKS